MRVGEVGEIDTDHVVAVEHQHGVRAQRPGDVADAAAGAQRLLLDDALELRGRIFGAFELAELSDDDDEIDRLLTFVVVGAGPTGVEMAGQIVELAHRTLHHDFRRINTREARVILLDAAPQVLPPFGRTLGVKTKHALEKLGVEVQLGAMVVDVDEHGIEVKDVGAGAGTAGTTRRIEARTKIWAAGVAASPLGVQLAEQSGAELDRSGRVQVERDLDVVPGDRGPQGQDVRPL